MVDVHRAFVVASHQDFGFLILRAEKKKKGVHFQLPGGRVDPGETPKSAAARELFEETGLDFRKEPERLSAVKFTNGSSVRKGRAYFRVSLSAADVLPEGTSPLSGEAFCLALSGEHTGYKFEKSLAKVASSVFLHSGGHNSKALYEMKI